MCEELVAGGVLPLIAGSINSSSVEAQGKGAELVAELAKVKARRNVSFISCTDIKPKPCSCMGNIDKLWHIVLQALKIVWQ